MRWLVLCLWLGGACILALGAVRGAPNVQHRRSLEHARDALEATVAQLRASVEQLSEELRILSSSSDYAAKLLRDKYNITEPRQTMMYFEEE